MSVVPLRIPAAVSSFVLLAAAAAAADPAPKADAFGDPLPAGAVARLGTVRFRHGHTVTSLSFSADGKVIASAANDGTVRVWDAATGALLRSCGGDPKGGLPTTLRYLTDVTLSADGKTVAAGCTASLVWAWDVGTGKQLFEARTPSYPGEVAFAPDGKAVAAGLVGGHVVLLDPETGKETQRWTAHKTQVNRVAFAPDGKSLATTARDGTLKIWDTSGKELFSAGGLQNPFYTPLAFSPDGKMVATADYGPKGKVHGWDPSTGQETFTVEAPVNGASGLAFTPDGKTLVAAGQNDLKVRFWDVAKKEQKADFQRPPGYLPAFGLSPDGKMLALAGDSAAVLLYDVEKLKRTNRLAAHEGYVVHVAFGADGKTLVTGSNDRTFRVWDRAGGEKRLVDPGMHTMTVSPDGKYGVSSSADGFVRLWDTETGKQVKQLKGHQGQVAFGAFSADGRTLATGNGVDQTLRLWDVAAEKELGPAIKTGYLQKMTLSPDGRTAAGVGNDNQLRFWEVGSDRPPRQGSEALTQATSMTFSPDGKLLATGSVDAVVRLWETASGKRVGQIAGHAGYVMAVAFSPDGRTLAAGNWGGVRFTDLTTGKEIAHLKGHLGDVTGVAFSPDGKFLLSGGSDTAALLWDLKDVAAPAAAAEPSAEELNAAWNDLAGDDAARAYQAVWRLSAAPKQGAAFLGGKLSAVAAPDARAVAKLIADLDADKDAARKAAMNELERLGRLAVPALKKALETEQDPDVKLRLNVILSRMDTATPSGERLRAGRAVQALELTGTAEAKRLLDKLGEGAEGAELTAEAKAAAARLARRLGEK
jgi:WD40 repeat protein